jgi:hypothetical protein
VNARSASRVGSILLALGAWPHPSFAGQAATPAAPTNSQTATDPPKAATFIGLDLPLVEGDLKVTGRTDAKTVMVRVYSAWLPENELTAADVRKIEEDKKNKEKETGKEAPLDPVVAQRLARYYASLPNLLAAEGEPDPDKRRTMLCVLSELVGKAGPIAVDKAQFDATLKHRLNGGECVVV